MTIHIKPFENINQFTFDEYLDNPYFNIHKIKELKFEDPPEDSLFYVFPTSQQRIDHWHRILYKRALLLLRNYGYATFYYDQGIRDEPYYVTTEDGKIRFFPNFDDKDYSNHFNFIYFAEYFFSSCFTYMDLVGHILFELYNLQNVRFKKIEEDISLKSAVKHLGAANPTLQKQLIKIAKSEDYKKVCKMRNDFTHNHPPGTIGHTINRMDDGTIVGGIGEYMSASEIKENMDKALKVLEEINNTLQ